MYRIKDFLIRLGLIQQSTSADYTCAICFETTKGEECEDDSQILNCGHIYHKKCIDRWIKCKNVCPMCRRQAVQDADLEHFDTPESSSNIATLRSTPHGRPPLSTYIDRMGMQ